MPPIALLLALALMQAPFEGVAAAPSTEHSTAAPKSDSDPVECHDQVMTGSHFSAKTCLHHSEWMRLHDRSMEGLKDRGHDRQPGLRPG